MGIKGRSTMNKEQLERAVSRKRRRRGLDDRRAAVPVTTGTAAAGLPTKAAGYDSAMGSLLGFGTPAGARGGRVLRAREGARRS